MGLHDCEEIRKEDITSLLQEGEWYISGVGITHKDAESGIPITRCELKGGMLLIRFSDPESQRALKHERTVIIEENQACFLTYPWQILVSEADRPFARPMRKVEQEESASDTNTSHSMGINMSYIYFALCKKEEAERHEREEREREAKETAERGKRLEVKINELYQGKNIKRIEYYSGFSIRILFDDAPPIEIRHDFDAGECYFTLNSVNLYYNDFDENADRIRPEDDAFPMEEEEEE